MKTGAPFCLLMLTALAIAIATCVEALWGTPCALRHIYGAWWFIALWGLTAAAGCVLLYRKRLWKHPPLFLLHASLLLILAGALATRLGSRSGKVHLREGEATRTYWARNGQNDGFTAETLPFFLALSDFRILYDSDGATPGDYMSRVVISTKDGRQQEVTISMNHIGRAGGYRIYQTSYDDDEGGSLFTVSYDPWGTGITYTGYLLLTLSMVWITLRRRRSSEQRRALSPWRGAGEALLTLSGTALASYMLIAVCRNPLVPVLRSPFLFVHVGTVMLSYILLVVSIARRELLRPAVFLLAIGIFLGAVWANVSWGTYWSWDPKESWALVTLLLYSLPLHRQSLPWFRSMRNYRIYSLLCLASLLMTYFGVNFIGGMHSYQ